MARKTRFPIVVSLAIALLGASCSKQEPQPTTLPPVHVALDTGNRYDLGRDEARGGHTLERHVGKTDAELAQRIDLESLSVDSTYADRATAEMAVAADLRENSGRLNRWLQRPGGHSNLVLDYDSKTAVGRSLRQGETQSFACFHAVAVLKWVSPREYFVLTSYPDCWKPK